MGEKDNEAVAGESAARLDRLLDRITHDVGAHIGVTYLSGPGAAGAADDHGGRGPQQVGPAVGPGGAGGVGAGCPRRSARRARCGSPTSRSWPAAFPRAALAFPYSVAMYVVPLVADGTCWGAVMLMWPGSRPEAADSASGRGSARSADRMAEVLRDAAAQGRPVRPRDEPLVMEPPPTGDASPRSPSWNASPRASSRSTCAAG